MPSASQVKFITGTLRQLADAAYLTRQVTRDKHLKYIQLLRRYSLIEKLTADLYGPSRSGRVAIPDADAELVLLSLKNIGGGRFNLLVFKPTNTTRRTRRIRCVVGHRFTKPIEECFRWNLRQLLDLFGIEEDYSGFDGAAVNIIDDLRSMIGSYDFCLFDNRETTNPSKPNVYIEAGMAFALRRPFIFCHYRKEVWPVDFSNVCYISYQSYQELFRKLYVILPVFLNKHVRRKRVRRA